MYYGGKESYSYTSTFTGGMGGCWGRSHTAELSDENRKLRLSIDTVGTAADIMRFPPEERVVDLVEELMKGGRGMEG